MVTDISLIVSSVVLPTVGFAVGMLTERSSVNAQAANRVFELRTYTAPEGKLGELQARFRNHTIGIFNRHNMTSIGYWVPQDSPNHDNTLVYMLAHKSREDAKANWAAFVADPEWQKVSTESQINGKILARIESVFLDPTDFSQIK